MNNTNACEDPHHNRQANRIRELEARAEAAEKRLEEAAVIHTNYQLELMGQIGDERRKRESAETLLVEAREVIRDFGTRVMTQVELNDLRCRVGVFLAKLAARGQG